LRSRDSSNEPLSHHQDRKRTEPTSTSDLTGAHQTSTIPPQADLQGTPGTAAAEKPRNPEVTLEIGASFKENAYKFWATFEE
jgi:hypothetical protein